ncbi:MAG: TIR domain-containing protein [Anaerolineaceae bacterium]|nr:TIR domain-containing protein [Anaerolineaceae bacterium]
MTRVFINYRRQDSEGYVGRLYDHLLRHFAPEDIFMDVASIEPGQDFVKALDEAVAACDVFVAVIGPQWAALRDEHGERRLDQWNDFVHIEIASALKREKLIVPALVGRAKMPAPTDLPDDIAALSRRNALELSHGNFAQDVERLIAIAKDAAPAKQSFKRGSDSRTRQRKTEALKAVRDDLVNATTSPLYPVRVEGRYFPVLGEGNPDANILFIGESPGKTEAQQGRPFCGPSGDILDGLLGDIGLARESVFITNILLDHPGAKREPTPEELAFYTPFADRLVDIIQPAVIVTLGRFAMQYLLKKLDLPEKRGTITQLHGKLIKARLPYGEIHIIPMYHPAVVLYSASQKEVLKQDFEKLKLFV